MSIDTDNPQTTTSEEREKWKKTPFSRKPAPKSKSVTAAKKDGNELILLTEQTVDDFITDGTLDRDAIEHYRAIVRQVGTVSIHRKQFEGRNLIQFDAIHNCKADKCPIHKVLNCPYNKDTTKNCVVLRQYVKAIGIQLLSRYKDLTDDLDFTNIGTMLLPKYIEAFRTTMIARAIGPIMKQPSGAKVANPLYKEVDRMHKGILEMHEYFDRKLAATVPRRDYKPSRFGESNSHAAKLMG